MFSFLRRAGDVPPDQQSPDSLMPSHLDEEERKAFRRELLYRVVKGALLSLEVNSRMYKFKVMNVDSRHHRFVIMIDVTKSFQIRKSSSVQSYMDIEQFIKKKAFDRFAIVVDSIYWRVSDTEDSFLPEHLPASAPVADSGAGDFQSQSQAGLRDEAVHSKPPPIANPFQTMSEDERRAFVEAIKRGASPPAVHVGDKVYQSDRLPLDEGDKINRTQYGDLE